MVEDLEYLFKARFGHEMIGCADGKQQQEAKAINASPDDRRRVVVHIRETYQHRQTGQPKEYPAPVDKTIDNFLGPAITFGDLWGFDNFRLAGDGFDDFLLHSVFLLPCERFHISLLIKNDATTHILETACTVRQFANLQKLKKRRSSAISACRWYSNTAGSGRANAHF